MIGVILWSDPHTGRAVVWTEDHGSLAFLSGEAASKVQTPFAAGDIIEFKLRISGAYRLVIDPRRQQSSWGKALPTSLQTCAIVQDAAAQDGSNVVQLHANSDRRSGHKMPAGVAQAQG